MRKGWWICQPVPYIQNVKYERPTQQENLRKCEDRHISITTSPEILKNELYKFFISGVFLCRAYQVPAVVLLQGTPSTITIFLLSSSFEHQKHLRVINWYYITWYSINFVLVLPKEMWIKREWFSLLFEPN